MTPPRLAIVGASGFVGSTLCERLNFTREFEYVPFVHSFGNTSRLARYPVELKPLDVMSPARVEDALAGFDVIVDLTRGLPDLMATMSRNIIRAATKHRVRKVVHLSSIAIYGKLPGPESATEAAVPVPDDDYGAAKFRQDELMLAMHRAGIPAVLICPANIYGPFAPFIIRAVQYLRSGQILLVDGGKTPTNNVHVENVVEAILAAIRSDGGNGERFFVNDPEPTTWAEFYRDLAAIIGHQDPIDTVAADQVRRALDASVPRKPRFRDNFGALVSGEFRKGLGHVPAFAKLNYFLYNQLSQQSPEFQARVRSLIARPTSVPKDPPDGPDIGNRYLTEQLRYVYHSPAKLRSMLGWSPFYSYRQGMDSVAAWLRFFNLA